MTLAAPQTRIASIQMLRLIAASLVLLLHAELIAYHTGRFLGMTLARPEWVTKGAFGVDLFFVISGFIMVHSSQGLHGQPGGRRTFVLRRLVRIVPLYWVGTLVMLAWVAKYGPALPGFRELAASLLFVPYYSDTTAHRIAPLLEVGWTLNFEMLFYLAFAAAMAASVRQTVLRLGLAFAAIVALGSAAVQPMPLWCWTRPIMLEFVGGMALGLLFLRGTALSLPVRIAMLALAAALIAFGEIDTGPRMTGWERTLTWGIAGVLTLGATVLGPLHLGLERLWNRGGDISYSLYLVHIPLMLAVQMVWRHFHLPYSAGIEIGFTVLICWLSFVAAGLAHDLFERPVTRWLQSKVGRHP